MASQDHTVNEGQSEARPQDLWIPSTVNFPSLLCPLFLCQLCEDWSGCSHKGADGNKPVASQDSEKVTDDRPIDWLMEPLSPHLPEYPSGSSWITLLK